ncbi:nucleic acid binding protein [Anaeramoeba flamelloides]|uniref:Nucleic acid binding protein n=1 Tax=Anaeramoeba flamelloides TaxID=1746091 RepID=A0AAV7YIM4_9EUKA|nr:nucleic acid binding protein [Anaeramoeba flamelloides]
MSTSNLTAKISDTTERKNFIQDEQQTNPQTKSELKKTSQIISKKKLFLGNLSFKSTEESLINTFKQFGEVKNCLIIRRGTKSLGYGFIKMGTVDGADKAIKLLNNKPVDGRIIVVEYADPRRAKRFKNPNFRFPYNNIPTRWYNYYGSNFDGFYQASYLYFPYIDLRDSLNGEYFPSEDSDLNNFNFINNYGITGMSAYEPVTFLDTNYVHYPYYEHTPNYSFRKKKPKKIKKKKKKSKKQSFDERDPSDTAVFITNIPFTFKTEDLLEVFKNFNPTKAKVVFSKVGKSRGFGFVDFKDKKCQKKALTLNETDIGGRKVNIKIAFKVSYHPFSFIFSFLLIFPFFYFS